MPKTKFQSFIFTLMMVFCMVYCMTLYTISLNSGSLFYGAFLLALKEMWIEYAVVFCLVFFFVTKMAIFLAKRISDKSQPAVFTMLGIQFFTVCLIVPMITLFATFFHNGFSREWFVQWISLAVKCFPMALCLQVALVGPLVRGIFRAIFK